MYQGLSSMFQAATRLLYTVPVCWNFSVFMWEHMQEVSCQFVAAYESRFLLLYLTWATEGSRLFMIISMMAAADLVLQGYSPMGYALKEEAQKFRRNTPAHKRNQNNMPQEYLCMPGILKLVWVAGFYSSGKSKDKKVQMWSYICTLTGKSGFNYYQNEAKPRNCIQLIICWII